MNKDILEAIQEIEADIKESHEKIELLKNFDERRLSEKIYHKLCDTSLRCSDYLGQLIPNQILSLKYNRRGVNYFFYTLPEENISVRIPSSARTGIELVVPFYYRKPVEPRNDIEYNAILENKNRKIQEIEKLLYDKSAKYYLGALTGKKSQWQRSFKQLVEERDKFIETQERQYNRQVENRKNQQTLIDKYAVEFLLWTDEVRVYGENANNPNLIITMEEERFIYTEK